MKRPPTIIFDLGGVLVENVTFSALSELLPMPMQCEDLRRRWLASESVRAFELGRIDPEAFAQRFLDEWHLDMSAEEFLDEFATWPRAFWPQSLALVDELRAHHRVACLSNCNELHWARFAGFADVFDVALSSHLLGAVKPDHEIFAAALTRLAVAPAETLFFDDSPACVEAAQGLGMHAYLADGPQACRCVLEAEGLL